MNELEFFNHSHKQLKLLCNRLLQRLFCLIGFSSNCDFNRAALLTLISNLGSPKTNILIGLKFLSILNSSSLKLSNNYASHILSNWHCSLRSMSSFFAHYQHELWLKVSFATSELYDDVDIKVEIKRQIRYETYRIICLDMINLDKIEPKKVLDKMKDCHLWKLILIDVINDLKNCKKEQYIKFVRFF